MNNDTKDKIPSNGNFSAKQDNQGNKLNKPSNTLNKGFNPNQFKDNAQKQLIKEGAKTAARAIECARMFPSPAKTLSSPHCMQEPASLMTSAMPPAFIRHADTARARPEARRSAAPMPTTFHTKKQASPEKRKTPRPSKRALSQTAAL